MRRLSIFRMKSVDNNLKPGTIKIQPAIAHFKNLRGSGAKTSRAKRRAIPLNASMQFKIQQAFQNDIIDHFKHHRGHLSIG